jgi:hypothetical protein
MSLIFNVLISATSLSIYFIEHSTFMELKDIVLWIHPHLGLVSYFLSSFLIWFASDVGVSATVNMYKHATLHSIYRTLRKQGIKATTKVERAKLKPHYAKASLE